MPDMPWHHERDRELRRTFLGGLMLGVVIGLAIALSLAWAIWP